MDEAARERLVRRLAEADSLVAGEGDSPDPVSRRRVLEALNAKARALVRLGRHGESAAVWGDIASRFADEPPAGDALFIARVKLNEAWALGRSGRHQPALIAFDDVVERCRQVEADGGETRVILGRALAGKCGALSQLRRREVAAVVDSEIVCSFGDATEPELRMYVAVALTRRAWWLLLEHRVDEALEVGDQLRERFLAETDPEAQIRLGELLLGHARTLLMVGSLSLDSLATSLVVVLGGAVGEGARVAGRRLRLDRLGGTQEWLSRSHALSGPERAVRRVTPAFFTVRRKRAAQARGVGDALISCFEDGPGRDHERIVATARIYSAAAAMLLGHVLDAFRRFEALTGSGQEAVAEAFRTQAANVATDTGVLAEFGAVANLAERARTLGQGDPQITRIAFEESTRAGEPGSPASRRARWFARLMAPGKRDPRGPTG